jgi:hypothetical protein
MIGSKRIRIWDLGQKYKNNYHILPLSTTLLISFTTCQMINGKWGMLKECGINRLASKIPH